MSRLISGFTLATTLADAPIIHTDTANLEAGDAKVPVPDGHLPAHFARRRKAGIPIVLVNEEIFGAHEHIKNIRRRLAKGGPFATATEFYARHTDRPCQITPASLPDHKIRASRRRRAKCTNIAAVAPQI